MTTQGRTHLPYISICLAFVLNSMFSHAIICSDEQENKPVCSPVSVFKYACIYMHTGMCVLGAHLYKYVCICTHMHMCIGVCVQVCICVHAHVHVYVICVCACIHMHVCMGG